MDTPLQEAWLRHSDFTIPEVETEERFCLYAQRLAEQLAELCRPALHAPSHVTVNQAWLQCCKKYWEWYYAVPKSHRRCVEERTHQCIHTVFRQASERLKTVELSLAPPMLFLPPPSVAPVVSVESIVPTGITLGEILGELS